MLIDRKSISAEIIVDLYKYLWDEYGARPMSCDGVSQLSDSGGSDWYHIYHFNASYLGSTVHWDHDQRKQHIYDTIEAVVPRDASVLDLGCASGITGLTLIKRGYTNVSFCDFPGIGERFIRYELERWGVKCGTREMFIEYGAEYATMSDWVLACDVAEHVPNPLTFLRWIYNLSKVGAVVSYPNIPWSSPYISMTVDMHIDTDLFLFAATRLFERQQVFRDHGGVEVVFRRGIDD